jgi:ABC-2 type transport system ATP-binding protein
MDEAEHCERVILINEGKIVADGAPAKIIRETCPDLPQASLNDAFIRLMARRNN